MMIVLCPGSFSFRMNALRCDEHLSGVGKQATILINWQKEDEPNKIIRIVASGVHLLAG